MRTRKTCFSIKVRLPDEVLKFERDLISHALAEVNGRITHAAKLLGIRYQTLASIIESRHPELLKQRTTIYRRPRRSQ
jgi:DNA-binding NtrC family response regulator